MARRSLILRLMMIAPVLAGLLSVGIPADAAKKHCNLASSPANCVKAIEGGLEVGISDRIPGRPPTLGGPPAHGVGQDELSLQIGAAFCAGASGQASREIAALCRGVAVPVPPGRDLILQAFKELPLYPGAIRTDPPTLTLVNLKTYFWCADPTGRDCTTIGESERTITLLGQQIRIRPRIIDYTWNFGDGTSHQTTDRKTTHEYRHATTATITLTLTWTADYALGNNPFQPINATTTTTSPPRPLPIREAQAVIVR